MEHTLALTRKLLEGMGIEDKQIETIIEAHSDTVTALKQERDKYKENAEKVPDLQKQLEEAKEAAKGDGDWHKKYDEEHKAFEDFKQSVDSQKKAADKAKAYRSQVLGKAGVADKYLDDLMGVIKLDDVELDDDGNIKDAEKLADGAKEKWASFIMKKETQHHKPSTPPEGGGEADGGDPDVAKRMAERHARKYGIQSEKE